MMMAAEEGVRKKKASWPSSSSACWWNFRVPFSLTFATYIAITGFLQLRKPLMNRCTMTYMYPSYIPVPPAVPEKNSTSNNNRHALYLYHEGWKKIDHQLHLAKLSGVPVLFIPGNGGSYEQVWRLNPKSHLSSFRRKLGLLLGFHVIRVLCTLKLLLLSFFSLSVFTNHKLCMLYLITPLFYE